MTCLFIFIYLYKMPYVICDIFIEYMNKDIKWFIWLACFWWDSSAWRYRRWYCRERDGTGLGGSGAWRIDRRLFACRLACRCRLLWEGWRCRRRSVAWCLHRRWCSWCGWESACSRSLARTTFGFLINRICIPHSCSPVLPCCSPHHWSVHSWSHATILSKEASTSQAPLSIYILIIISILYLYYIYIISISILYLYLYLYL